MRLIGCTENQKHQSPNKFFYQDCSDVCSIVKDEERREAAVTRQSVKKA
jgi:hypothetical protein